MGCCTNDEDTASAINADSLSNKGERCTDVPCCMVFLVFVFGMFGIAGYAFVKGDIYRVYYGYDSFGNTCGRTNAKIPELQQYNLTYDGRDMTNKRKVFFMDILHWKTGKSICVEKCPKEKLNTLEDIKQFAKENNSKLCMYGVDPNNYIQQSSDKSGPCPVLPVFGSISILSRCIPKLSSANLKEVANKITNSSLGLVIKDYMNNVGDYVRNSVLDFITLWKQIIIICLIIAVVAFLFVLILRYIAAVLIYVTIVLSIVGSLAATVFLWWQFYDIIKNNDKQKDFNVPGLDIDISNKKVFLGLAITFSISAVILILVIIVMFKRIRLVIALFHEAGKVFANTPSLLLQPIWTTIVMIIFITSWVFGIAYLSSLQPPVYNNKTGAVRFEADTKQKILIAYFLVGLIWIGEFIIACQQIVVSGVVADWYFDRKKSFIGLRVVKATKNLIIYHLGSVAFGAFIITLVKIPRAILLYIDYKTKDSRSKVADVLLKCCHCCLWCLEKCLKFLNENAYTIIVIRGSNFCSSACEAFKIITENFLRVAAINCAGNFVLFLGKIGITGIGGAITIAWWKFVRSSDEDDDSVRFWAIPVIFMCIFSFLLAHCFLSVYDMVVDALLLCFCLDSKLNDGSEEKPYFMSKSLMKLSKDGNKNVMKINADPEEIPMKN